MNQAQLKYARERANSILSSRTAAIRDKHTTPAQCLSYEEKLDALSVGSFTIDMDAGRNRYGSPSVSNAIRYTAESEAVIEQDLIDAETAALTEAHRVLIDELVLGDDDTALLLLKAFEA